jgi:hypothetical protein
MKQGVVVLQLVATRVITPGEAILWTYGDAYAMDCQCGECKKKLTRKGETTSAATAASLAPARATDVPETLSFIQFAGRSERVKRVIHTSNLALLRLKYMKIWFGHGATQVPQDIVQNLNAPGMFACAREKYAECISAVGSGSDELFATGPVFQRLLLEENPLTKQVYVLAYEVSVIICGVDINHGTNFHIYDCTCVMQPFKISYDAFIKSFTEIVKSGLRELVGSGLFTAAEIDKLRLDTPSFLHSFPGVDGLVRARANREMWLMSNNSTCTVLVSRSHMFCLGDFRCTLMAGVFEFCKQLYTCVKRSQHNICRTKVTLTFRLALMPSMLLWKDGR